MLGDWWDMRSCSYYDKGKKSRDADNYIEDIESGNDAMQFFLKWLDKKWRGNRKKCKRILLKGNHENRTIRAGEYGDSNMRELIVRYPMDVSGWDKVIPFLKEYKIERCYFSHYFPNVGTGRPINTAKQLLTKKHKTCIAGHKQGFDCAEDIGEGDEIIHGIIAGSAYTHDEDYISPSNNRHFRGTLVLRDLKGSTFDLHKHSTSNLMKRYK